MALRPFNTLSPEERRELARKGGLASGERRRYLADLRLEMIETLAGCDLARDTREEYRRAIQRYVKEERRKQKRSKTEAKNKGTKPEQNRNKIGTKRPPLQDGPAWMDME